MPTGYTCAVQDGKVSTLRDFALQCARGMGALIMMRDDPWDAPIPKQFLPQTSHYDEHIEAAKKILAELPNLEPYECDARAQAEFDAQMASHLKYASSRSLSKIRYLEMLGKVENWRPVDGLTGLKDFMVEQLNESIKFDCPDSYRPERPKRLTGERWREQKLEEASRDLAYNSEEREEEIQRTESRNRWLKALWDSLPDQPEAKAA